MSVQIQESSESQSSEAQIIKMATAHWVSRIVHTAAELELVDRLSDGPRTAKELARSISSDAPSLYRLMRTLASLGLFTEDSDNRFSLTPLGEALKIGTPGRASVLTLAGEGFKRALDELPYSVKTGQSGFEKAYGTPYFQWLADHPKEASLFSETMVGIHGPEPAAVAAAYDFSELGVVVDVGGATGNLLAAILSRYPKPNGILFDLPHVVSEAPPLLKARGVADRIRIATGSFFDNVPSGGDAYLLSHIIHDWGEAQCMTILVNCRRAMKVNSRLLIIETVLEKGDAPHLGKMLDMIMLAFFTGAQERTEQEYRKLLDKAEFRLTRVVPTESAVSIVEAVPI